MTITRVCASGHVQSMRWAVTKARRAHTARTGSARRRMARVPAEHGAAHHAHVRTLRRRCEKAYGSCLGAKYSGGKLLDSGKVRDYYDYAKAQEAHGVKT